MDGKDVDEGEVHGSDVGGDGIAGRSGDGEDNSEMERCRDGPPECLDICSTGLLSVPSTMSAFDGRRGDEEDLLLALSVLGFAIRFIPFTWLAFGF